MMMKKNDLIPDDILTQHTSSTQKTKTNEKLYV